MLMTVSGNFFDVLLTVRLSILLESDQLDAQFLYFVTLLLQSSTSFEQRRAHHRRSNCINKAGRDRGGTVVKVLCYKSEGRWFDPRWFY